MANAAGMLKESIWRDKEFRALPRTAQTTYAQLVSQKELDRAGMQPLQVSKWAKGCDEITESDVWDDLKVLEEHRFVFVDEDTDELFIRSYMRHCEVVRYPNILKNALRCAGLVASQGLRHELALELRRLRRADAERVADAIDPALSAEPQRNGSGTKPNPSGTVPEGVNGSGTVREPQGYGTGSGSVTLGSSQVGRGAEESNGTTETSHDPYVPPPSKCRRHEHVDNPPGCHDCRRAREAREAWEGRQELAERQRVKAAAQQLRECPLCDEAGWALDEDGLTAEPARKCTHPAVVPHA